MSNYIGIDISKATLDVYVATINKYFKLTNDISGYKKLFTIIAHNKLLGHIIAFEPTGGYEGGLRAYLVSQGLRLRCDSP